jgi:hypothetical protein
MRILNRFEDGARTGRHVPAVGLSDPNDQGEMLEDLIERDTFFDEHHRDIFTNGIQDLFVSPDQAAVEHFGHRLLRLILQHASAHGSFTLPIRASSAKLTSSLVSGQHSMASKSLSICTGRLVLD